MTTATRRATPRQPTPAPAAMPAILPAGDRGAATSEPETGCFLLPLAEFGMSPASPKLDEWLAAFSERNAPCGVFEITAAGELKVMPPTGIPGYWQESEITADLVFYARSHGGRAGGPSGRFRLPDGSRLGPDAVWFSAERWDAAADADKQPPFAALAPDFIVEIVSPSNRGPALVDKVARFLAHGTRLAWVINPARRLVTIYRPGREAETRHNPELLDGEDVLPGFVFEVRARIFDNAG